MARCAAERLERHRGWCPQGLWAVLGLAGLALGAGGCFVFDTVLGAIRYCGSDDDCYSDESCVSSCADGGGGPCFPVCAQTPPRRHRFLEEQLLGVDGGRIDAGVDAGVVDAGPPPPPAILSFEVWGAGPDAVWHDGGIIEYGTRPGYAYTTRGMSGCEVFIPGEALVGGGAFMRALGPSYEEPPDPHNDNNGLLAAARVTLRCAVRPPDGAAGVDAGVRVEERSVTVACTAPTTLPGDLQLSGSGFRPPSSQCHVVGGDLVITGVDVDGVSIGRSLADVIEVQGGLRVNDNAALTSLDGVTGVDGGLRLTAFGGPLFISGNGMLTDVSALDPVTFSGAADVNGAPTTLLVQSNLALPSLTGVHLAETVAGISIQQNPSLDPDSPLGAAVVEGEVILDANPSLTSATLLAGIARLERLRVGFVGQSALEFRIDSLREVGTPATSGQTNLLMLSSPFTTIAFPALDTVYGDIDLKRSPVDEGLTSIVLGTGPLSFDGSTLTIVGASDPALAAVCETVRDNWGPDAGVAFVGRLDLFDPTLCTPP